jgi:hypothetical protein
MKMKQIEFYETSAYKIQKPGNYREENIQHTEYGESLKSIIYELELRLDKVDCSLVCGNEVATIKRNHDIRMLQSKLIVFGEKQTETKRTKWTKINTQIK